jgi:hypothetical protein
MTGPSCIVALVELRARLTHVLHDGTGQPIMS